MARACSSAATALGENLYDASPNALNNKLKDNLTPQQLELPVLTISDADFQRTREDHANRAIASAFAPEPTIPPATDILFDAWALTGIRQPMPGRPPVGPYLHGIAEWQPPETHVAWREELDVITGDLLGQYDPADLLDDYPLKPHELLRDLSDRIFKHIETLSKRHPDKSAWIIDDREAVEVTTLEKLVDKQRKDRINGCTILLPPSAGWTEGRDT